MTSAINSISKSDAFRVWITTDRYETDFPLPAQRKNGLTIVLHTPQNPEQLKIYYATIILTNQSNQRELPVKSKIIFMPRVSQRGVALIDFQKHIDQSAPDLLSIDEIQRRFCPIAILLGNRKSYSAILEFFPPNTAKKLLEMANDIVALDEFRPSSRLLMEVKNTGNIWSQFFSEEEERFSRVSFTRLLNQNRKRNRDLSEIEELHADVPIWGDRFELSLRLSFPVVLGERQLQNVIIGPNGAGKTNILFGLAKRATAGDVIINGIFPTNDDYENPISVAVFTYEPSLWSNLRRDNLEVYEQGVRASNWRQFSQLIYDIGLTENGVDLALLAEILTRFVKIEELYFSLQADPIANPTGLKAVSLAELVSRQRLYEVFLPVIDRSESPFMMYRDGQKYNLSSGERSLALFCAKLMKAGRHGALILIDEPENHLHPKFITLMMQTLSSLLHATGSRALLVTHSPFVVREFDRSTVKVLKSSSDGVPELFRPSMQTFGGDVAMISDHVFDDDGYQKGFELSIDRVIRTQQIGGDVRSHEWQEAVTSELGIDARSYLVKRIGTNSKEQD